MDKQRQINHVSELKTEKLKSQGIAAVIIDFDGVLAPHGDLTPTESVLFWLADLTKKLADNRIFILSNKPLVVRERYFADLFPKIVFIRAKRKKPYPDGIEEILTRTQLKKTQIALIDDRLATGVLATMIAGIQSYWVVKPCMHWIKRPIRESFFWGLRALEKNIVRWLF